MNKYFSKEFLKKFKCKEDFNLYQNKLREYLSLYKFEVIVKEYEDLDSNEEFTVIFEVYIDGKNISKYHDDTKFNSHLIDLLYEVDKKYYDPLYYKEINFK